LFKIQMGTKSKCCNGMDVLNKIKKQKGRKQ